MQAAGAPQARLLVVAVDDRDAAVQIVERVRQAYPHLRLLVRAYDVPHYYALRKAGAHVIQREVFESSLLLGRRALEGLGIGPYEAKEMADAFRRTNQAQLDEFARLREQTPQQDFVKAMRDSREELERQLRAEVRAPRHHQDWQVPGLRAQDDAG